MKTICFFVAVLCLLAVVSSSAVTISPVPTHSGAASSRPSSVPSTIPSTVPSTVPSTEPSTVPSAVPSTASSTAPSTAPSTVPSTVPSPEPWESNPLIVNRSTTNPELLRRLRALRQNVRDKGCEVNLCFALQGDEFITESEFQAQKDFVDLIVAILTTDEPGNFCAVQYGRTTKFISSLTKNKIRFLNRVANAKQVKGLQTNIAAALGYTGFQLRPRIEDANKIILLGDGLETIGFRPRRVAKRVLEDGTGICAVAVGGFSTDALLSIVKDENLIFEIDEFFDLAEVIYGFVTDICGL